MNENTTDKYITEISRFIEIEDNTLERAKLMMHLSIIQENKANIDALKSMKHEHNRRITDTESAVFKHSKVINQFQAVIIFVAFLAGGAGTILYNAANTMYVQVDNLRLQQQSLSTKVDYIIDNLSSRNK